MRSPKLIREIRRIPRTIFGITFTDYHVILEPRFRDSLLIGGAVTMGVWGLAAFAAGYPFNAALFWITSIAAILGFLKLRERGGD